PDLVAGQHLARSRSLPPRAPVLDRNGMPLVTSAPVVVVGVVPNRLKDVNAALAVLQRTTGADPNRVKAAIGAAKPDVFVSVITLRRPAFDAARPTLEPVPGIVFQSKNADLAPTTTFALAVLGKVGPATAEALKRAGPGFVDTDDVGVSGLELVYQRRVAGSPAGSIA